MLENTFLWKYILLLSFQALKIYSKALARKLNAPRYYIRLSWVDFYLKDDIIAIDQTRSQKDKVLRNIRYYSTCKRLATKNEYLQVQSVSPQTFKQ